METTVEVMTARTAGRRAEIYSCLTWVLFSFGSREWEAAQQPLSLPSWQLGVPHCWPQREKEEKKDL